MMNFKHKKPPECIQENSVVKDTRFKARFQFKMFTEHNTGKESERLDTDDGE